MVKTLISARSSTMSEVEFGGLAVEDSALRREEWEEPIRMFVFK